MPDQIWLNEPIPEQRDVSVVLSLAGNGVSGAAAGATIKIAKPGANLLNDGACTLTEVTGGADVGMYRVRLSADAVSAQGEVDGEITNPGVIQTCRFSVIVKPLTALFYGKTTAKNSATTYIIDSASPGGVASTADGYYAKTATSRKALLRVVGGTGKGQHRLVTDYAGSGHGGGSFQITIDEAFVTDLDVSGGANNSIVEIVSIVTTPELSTDARLDTAATILTNVANVQARLPGALDGSGNMKSGVQGFANGAITAAAFAANSIAAAAIAADSLAAIAGAVMGSLVESTLTLKHAMQAIFSQAASKVSGFSANAPKYRDFADTKDRVSGTTTADGRSVVNYTFD